MRLLLLFGRIAFYSSATCSHLAAGALQKIRPLKERANPGHGIEVVHEDLVSIENKVQKIDCRRNCMKL
jgi:hypothetical protein